MWLIFDASWLFELVSCGDFLLENIVKLGILSSEPLLPTFSLD